MEQNVVLRDKVIVYCVNDWEVAWEWLFHSIESVCKFIPNVDIVVIRDFENQKFKERFDKINPVCNGCCNCYHINIGPLLEKELKDIPFDKRVWHNKPASRMMFARLFLPYLEILLGTKKCLYLDIDTEVVDERFAEIFDIETGMDEKDCDVFGVIDCATDRDRRECLSRRSRKFLWRTGLYENARFWDNYTRLQQRRYINSGVMLMNLDLIRCRFNHKFITECISNLIKGDDISMDQDLINAIFRCGIIKSSFNTFEASHIKGDEPYLLHYVGNEKVKSYPTLTKEMFK